MIPLQIELGGKAACFVVEEIDFDLVASNVIFNTVVLSCAHFRYMFSHKLKPTCQLQM
jgi:hypothetical protein